jgi:pimeloyl-ACP methyl ester carboxylesterase
VTFRPTGGGRVIACLLALVVAAGAGGCADLLATAIVSSPNRGKDVEAKAARRAFEGRSYRVGVGPPPATIALSVVDPEFRVPAGTVFLLHGISEDRRDMEKLASGLVEAGFRAVLVDLRGHGVSSGDWLSYGVFESADLVQVADHMERAGELTGPVGVVGMSFGGSVALLWTARDERVRAVVTIATFTSMTEAVHSFARHYLPSFAVSDETLDEAIALAGARGGFDPAEASPLEAVPGCRAPILFIHGMSDKKLPPTCSERLADAAPDGEVLLVEHHSHVSIERSRIMHRETVAWMTRHLRGSEPAVGAGRPGSGP